MVYFMCYGCGYLLRLKVDNESPPHECPACSQACAFVNVTSYRPEVGVGNPDTKLMEYVLDATEAWKKARANGVRASQGLMSSRTGALCREAALIALRDLLEQKRKAGLLRSREPVDADRSREPITV